MKVAVINCGSSSIKYEVFDVRECVMLATGLAEKIGSADGRLRQRKRKAGGSFEGQSFTKNLADHCHASYPTAVFCGSGAL
jgi:acetate kinase